MIEKYQTPLYNVFAHIVKTEQEYKIFKLKISLLNGKIIYSFFEKVLIDDLEDFPSAKIFLQDLQEKYSQHV